jgi:hypothetical protein
MCTCPRPSLVRLWFVCRCCNNNNNHSNSNNNNNNKKLDFFSERKSFSYLYRRRRDQADRVPWTRPQTVASRHDRSAAMSALTAGVQYSLSSNQNNGLMPKQRTGKNKTLFFVKLTDSCLKAVEDYLRCCQQVRTRPKVPTDLFAIYATIFSLGDLLFSSLLGPLRPSGHRLRDFSCVRLARLVSLRPRPHIHSTSVFRFFWPKTPTRSTLRPRFF